MTNCKGGSGVPSSDLRYPAGILSCSVVHTCMFPFVMCRNKGAPPQRRSKQQELDTKHTTLCPACHESTLCLLVSKCAVGTASHSALQLLPSRTVGQDHQRYQ